VTAANWISLAAIIVSLLTPAAIAVLAFTLNKRFKHFERSLEEQRRVSETRFELYKEIGFQLNDLYAYFNYVGNWKSQSPAEVIDRKRALDRHVFTYRPIFSQEFNANFDRFILSCFQMYGGWRKDARLRTTSKHRTEDGDLAFAECFTQEDNRAAIRESYRALLDCLAKDLGVSQAGVAP
jgi:hypothetical protein